MLLLIGPALALAGCTTRLNTLRKAVSTSRDNVENAAPQMNTFTISESTPTNHRPLAVTWGLEVGTHTHYCILENDTDSNHCIWHAGALPSSYLDSASDGPLVLTGYVKNLYGISIATLSNSVTIDHTTPLLASATVTNSDPTNTAVFNLVYGAQTNGTYAKYCIQTNSSAVAGCTWTTGTLPSTYTVSGGDGAKVLTVWIQDAAGNISTAVDTPSITYDAGLPSVAITSPTAGAYINAAGVASTTVSGTCSENGRNVTLSGAVTGTATCTTGTWSVNANFTSASDGTVSVTATHTDAAANSATDSRNFTKDVVAPSLAVTAPNGGEVIGGSTYSITWTASDATTSVGVLAIDFSANSGSTWSSVATNLTASTGTYTWTLPAATDTATALVRISASDAAGNAATDSSNAVFTLDTVAPVLASASITNTSPTSNTTFNLSYGAVTGTFAKYCININDTAVGNCSWTTGTSLPSTFVVNAVDEAKVLTIWLQDAAGNISAAVSTNSVTLDRGPSGSGSTITKSCAGSPATILAGATCTITITSKNTGGTNIGVGGAAVTIGNSGGTSTLDFCATITDVGNGTYTCVVTGHTSGTATTITATINSASITTTAPQIKVNPGAVSLTGSTVENRDGTALASSLWLFDLVGYIRVVLRDAYGNMVTTATGRTVTQTLTGGTSDFKVSTNSNDMSNGTYIAWLQGTVAGTAKTIGATITGTPSGALNGTLPSVQVKYPWVTGVLPGLKDPMGISVRSGKVYVAENSAGRVQIRTTAGVPLHAYGKLIENENYDAYDHAGFLSVATTSTGLIKASDGLGRIRGFNANFSVTQNDFAQSGTPHAIAIHPTDDTKFAFLAEEFTPPMTYLCALTMNATTGVLASSCSAGLIHNSFGTGNGEFNVAHGLAYDHSGNIYVADTGNNRIQKFTSALVYVGQFGTAGTGNGQFNAPKGVTVDAAGNIWVADTGNNRVQVFDSSFTFVAAYGSKGVGPLQFDTPSAITIDTATGDVWVADTANHRVVHFSNTGTPLSTFGGRINEDGSFGGFAGIGNDASGNVYIPDTQFNKLTIYDRDMHLIRRIDGSTSGTAFSGPTDAIGMPNGKFAVVDAGNARVVVFNQSDGSYAFQFGSFGTGNSQFKNPWGIATDASSNLYVTDLENSRVTVFNSTGTYVLKFGSQGTGATQFGYQGLRGIAVDGSGNIYVAEWANTHNNIRKYSSTGTYISTVVAAGAADNQGDSPQDIAIDSANDRLYVASLNTWGSVKIFTLSTGALQTRACKFIGNDVSTADYRRAHAAIGITFDPSTGDYYVAETENSRVSRHVVNDATCAPVDRGW